MNILLTSVGRRSYLVKYFKEALGESGEIHVSNSTSLTPAFSYADKSTVTPMIYDNEYIPYLLKYAQENNIKAIISLFDVDLPILAKNKEKFEEIGVEVVVSDERVIDICNDKINTFNFLVDNEINTPATFKSIEETVESLEKNEISYPLIIKPRWGMGSIGVFKANNEEELHVLYNKTLNEIKSSYLKYESKELLNESVIIQEKLQGQEYGLDVINDLSGKYVATIVKQKYQMRAGETDSAITVDDSMLEALGKIISQQLGHIGNLDVDVFVHNNTPYVLEMNARFGGGYPFSHQAGVNLPKAIISWLNGKEASNDLFEVEYDVLSHKDIEIVEIKKNETDITIEELKDKKKIVELLEEMDNEFSPAISSKVDIDEYAAKLSDNATVFVAKLDDIVGFSVIYANDTIDKNAYIPYIGVKSNAQNRSIGTKLLEKCLTEAKNEGMKQIKLEVQKDNQMAQSFYRKNGFSYLEAKDNTSIYMVKEL